LVLAWSRLPGVGERGGGTRPTEASPGIKHKKRSGTHHPKTRRYEGEDDNGDEKLFIKKGAQEGIRERRD